jgi:hypothetical protein
MASGKYNITAEQGSTFVLDFTVSTDGSPWNLSTYSARMQVRAFTSSTDKLLDLSEALGDIVLNASGRVVITVSASRMAGVVEGKHYYDVELVSAGNEVTRILEGRFVVRPEVSR